MEFRILGSLEVHDELGSVALGGIKPRAVLAVLLLHPNEPVSAERLSIALWGDDAPASAVKTVQSHVSRLRKALRDPDALVTTPGGYRLRVREDELDAARFERLVEDARRALTAGDAERGAALARRALALWRGPPLADLAFEPFAQHEIGRLEEQRLAAVELRAEADLAAGRHAALVAELRRLVSANPTRERFAELLMLALYRCGRQADALEAFRAARSVLVEQVGVEPGPSLRRLEAAMLRQDPALDLRPAVTQLPEELDVAGAPALRGRAAELAQLREVWDRARSGRGALLALLGVRGAGKSRLAAALASEAHAQGATVRYVDATSTAEDVAAALTLAGGATSPTLLVVDDADRAGERVLAAIAGMAPALRAGPHMALACGCDSELLDRLGADATLVVGPLDADAVSAIAVSYVAGRAAGGPSVAGLLEQSAGVPGRVHELAGEWARAEVSRRVSSVAGDAAAGRSRLHAMERELARDLVELQSMRGAIPTDREAPVVCPFKGLAAFEVADAPYFAGRERLVAQLVARLVGAPMLAIVGASGSGKSSILGAGLLPALASGVLPGSKTWTQLVIRPGEHPLRELEHATAGLDGERRFVLAVDQFEELFTICRDERERAAFAAELAAIAEGEPGVVVVSVRADHYGRCGAYPTLAALLAANHVLVGPPRRGELRRAVTEPARRAGLHVEPGLADALVADVEDEPGALPLLSAALLELWQQRDGRRLSLAAYEHTGGVRGAVARLAEDAFTRLDGAGQDVARRVLMALVGLTADGEVERRRVSLATFEGDAAVAGVLARFTDRRLLTVSEGTVEVAHEALLREWPRIGDWIREDRDELRIARELGGAAREWERAGRDDGALYRGLRLAEAVAWHDARAPALSELELEFLAASRAGRARERALRHRRTRLAGTALAAVAAALVAVVATVVFAERARDVAASGDLAARSSRLVATDPPLALAAAFEALDRSDTTQARNALRQATLEHRQRLVVRAHAGLAFALAVSPDGRRAATAGDDGTVRVWRLRDGRRVAEIRGHDSEVRAVSFSNDGTLLASASRRGQLAVTAATGGPVNVVARLGGDDFAASLQFRPGDETLTIGTDRGRVARLSRHDGGLRALTPGDPDGVTAVRSDARLRRMVSVGYGGFGEIADATGEHRRTLAHDGQPVLDAAFSPGGDRVATVDVAGTLRLWRAASGALTAPVELGEPLASVGFSGDGQHLVTAGKSGVISVLTVHGGGVLAELRGHRGPARAAYVPGSDTIVSLGEEDGTLRTWTAPPATVATQPGTSPRFSHDGRLVVSGDPSGSVHVWNPRTGEQRDLRGREDDGDSYPQFAPGDDKVVSAADGGAIRLWDLRSGRARDVPSLAGQKLSAAIDGSGTRIAIGGQTPLVIQAADGHRRDRLPAPPTVRVNVLVFSPDGRFVLTAGDDATARIWDVRSGALVRVLRGHEGVVRSVAYSDDGHRIATAGSDGKIRVWPADGGNPVILVGHGSGVNTAEFDASGDRLVSAGDDGTIRVWDTRGGEARVVLHRYRGVASGADFGDGATVVSAGDGVMQTTRCDVCSSFEDALRVARSRPLRRLTPVERRELLAGR